MAESDDHSNEGATPNANSVPPPVYNEPPAQAPPPPPPSQAPPPAMPGTTSAPAAAAPPVAMTNANGSPNLQAISDATGIPISVLQYWLNSQTVPNFTAQHEIYQAEDGHIYHIKRDTQGRSIGYEDLGTDPVAAATFIGMPQALFNNALASAQANNGQIKRDLNSMKQFQQVEFGGYEADGVTEKWIGTDYWGNHQLVTRDQLLNTQSSSNPQLQAAIDEWKYKQTQVARLKIFSDIAFGGYEADGVTEKWVATDAAGKHWAVTREGLLQSGSTTNTQLTTAIQDYTYKQAQAVKMGKFTEVTFGGNAADPNSFSAKNFGGATVTRTRQQLIENGDATESDLNDTVNNWDAAQKRFDYNKRLTESRVLTGYGRAGDNRTALIGQ